MTSKYITLRKLDQFPQETKDEIAANQPKLRTAEDARRDPRPKDEFRKRNITRLVTGLFTLPGGATSKVQCVDNYANGGVSHPWPRLAQFQAWAKSAEVLHVAQEGGGE